MSVTTNPVTVSPLPDQNRLRENPERLAWLILICAFVLFVLLVISIPLTIRYTLEYASVREPALLEPTIGTVRLYPPRTSDPMAISSSYADVREGSRIVTESEATQGILGFLGAAENQAQRGTVHLFPDTELEILKSRRPRFQSSSQPYRIHLKLMRGRVRIFTINPDQRLLTVEVDTPQGQIFLQEGTYKLAVVNKQTEVTVQSGSATLISHSGEQLTLTEDQRSFFTADSAPHAAMSPERNLLTNGDFSEPLLQKWEITTVAKDVTPGAVRRSWLDGRWVARYQRLGADNVHTEVSLRQTVNQYVNVYDSLHIQLDVRLEYQSLAGAGDLSSEYPTRVEIGYTDIYGKDLTWGHGFYYRDPEPGRWIDNGEKIRRSIWYAYESPNLLDLLSDTRPDRINYIRIYASGHNYDAMVSNANLIVK